MPTSPGTTAIFLLSSQHGLLSPSKSKQAANLQDHGLPIFNFLLCFLSPKILLIFFFPFSFPPSLSLLRTFSLFYLSARAVVSRYPINICYMAVFFIFLDAVIIVLWLLIFFSFSSATVLPHLCLSLCLSFFVCSLRRYLHDILGFVRPTHLFYLTRSCLIVQQPGSM